MFGQPFESRSVWMDKINIGQLQMFPTPLRRRQRAAASRGESDPIPVRRPRGTEIAAHSGQRLSLACAQVKSPEIRPAPGPSADKDDLFAIWRECSLIIVSRMLGELFKTGTIRLNAIQIRRTVAFGSKDNPFAVAGPSRIVVEAFGFEERTLVATIG